LISAADAIIVITITVIKVNSFAPRPVEWAARDEPQMVAESALANLVRQCGTLVALHRSRYQTTPELCRSVAMTSRLVASMVVLLSVPGIAVAGDSPAKRSTGQTVGRAASLTIPKLQAQRTSQLADLKSSGRMQVASPLKLPGMAQVLAAAKSAGRNEKLDSQPARSSNLALPSSVLQLVTASPSPPSGQNVLTLVPQPKSGQKVLTLVPQPHAEDRSAQILQFTDDKQQPAATILPLGVNEEESEPAATLLQFED
jgi:hypothetical protein